MTTKRRRPNANRDLTGQSKLLTFFSRQSTPPLAKDGISPATPAKSSSAVPVASRSNPCRARANMQLFQASIQRTNPIAEEIADDLDVFMQTDRTDEEIAAKLKEAMDTYRSIKEIPGGWMFEVGGEVYEIQNVEDATHEVNPLEFTPTTSSAVAAPEDSVDLPEKTSLAASADGTSGQPAEQPHSVASCLGESSPRACAQVPSEPPTLGANTSVSSADQGWKCERSESPRKCMQMEDESRLLAAVSKSMAPIDFRAAETFAAAVKQVASDPPLSSDSLRSCGVEQPLKRQRFESPSRKRKQAEETGTRMLSLRERLLSRMEGAETAPPAILSPDHEDGTPETQKTPSKEHKMLGGLSFKWKLLFHAGSKPVKKGASPSDGDVPAEKSSRKDSCKGGA